MAVDRRWFTLGTLAALTVACGAGESNGRGAKADDWWQRYRAAFLSPDGRIIDTGNGGISHSEGQGYGMILAFAANDRDAFSSIFQWTEQSLSRGDVALYSWRYDPRETNPVADPNNATDGDMLIAWALALAGKRWKMQHYLDRSAQIRSAIRNRCVISRYGRLLLLPGIQGFVTPAGVTVNPSYFIWPALDTFAALDGQHVWGQLIADCEDLVRLAKFGPHRLPPDWLIVTGTSQVAPAASHPPRFGFDAIRIALYSLMGMRLSLAADIGTYWRQRLAQQQPIPAWIDVVTGEEAPYPVSEGGAAIVGRLLGTAEPTTLSADYFAASLQMLVRARL